MNLRRFSHYTLFSVVWIDLWVNLRNLKTGNEDRDRTVSRIGEGGHC
jgi:hypothetical protein